MNKRLSKIMSYLLKNIKIVTVITLLCISVFYNMKLTFELDKFLINKDIKGTYVMQSYNSHDSEYFVFFKRR